MNKFFDLRFVIGLFFLIVGLLLLGYALFSTGAAYKKEVNLYGGILLASFGTIMLTLLKGKQ